MENKSGNDNKLFDEILSEINRPIDSAINKLQSEADKANLLGCEIEILIKKLVDIKHEKEER